MLLGNGRSKDYRTVVFFILELPFFLKRDHPREDYRRIKIPPFDSPWSDHCPVAFLLWLTLVGRWIFCSGNYRVISAEHCAWLYDRTICTSSSSATLCAGSARLLSVPAASWRSARIAKFRRRRRS